MELFCNAFEKYHYTFKGFVYFGNCLARSATFPIGILGNLEEFRLVKQPTSHIDY